jgi:uncharacterized protein YkwD
MKPLAPKLLLALVFAVLLSSCSNDEDGIFFNETSEIEKDITITYSSLELQILDLVNNHRKSIDLDPLTTLNIVSSVAVDHTEYMIKVGQINHDNFAQRADKLMQEAKAKTVAENVAYGFNSAEGVLAGWLNSPSHKKIIESENFTHFGISTKSNNEGRNFFTHIFIEK